MASKLSALMAALFGHGRPRLFSLAAAVAVVLLVAASAVTLLRPPVEIRLAPESPNVGLGLAWFGSGQLQPEPQTALTTANINGQLLGVLVAGSRSTATLKLQGKPEQVFRLGDSLASGTRLVAVEHHRVVVEQRGVRRELLLNTDSLDSSEFSAVDDSDGQTSAQPGSSGAALALAGMFRAQPIALEGGGRGLLLSEIGDEMAILTDLQSGDVVLGVERAGETYSVEQLTAEPGLWAGLALESELPVTVQRDGAPITLLINAASLAARVMPNLSN